MRQGSEQALERMLRSWEGVVANQPLEANRWADELFAVGDVLESSAALNRAVTDPSRTGESRAELAKSLFSGKVSGEVTDFVAGLARERFSAWRDFAEAVERSAVETLLMSAHHQGRLDAVEEELYRASRTLGDERPLRRALEERGTDKAKRIELAERVFGSWTPETVALIKHAASTNESVIPHLRRWVADAGRRSEHLVAIVTAAQPLDSDQEERLRSVLSHRYGKPVQIHVGVDPEIIGGLRIVIGADVIDGSLASRINNVKSVFTD